MARSLNITMLTLIPHFFRGQTICIALTVIFEGVNTFATESMGLSKSTGKMTMGFRKWSGQELSEDCKGSKY